MEATKLKLDVYEIITSRIISQLEQGIVPWRKPWTEAGIPRNLISRRAYRGINIWLLAAMNYQQNFFLTWKQVKELGGNVIKGEKAHIVIFTRWIERTQKGKGENAEEKSKVVKIPFLRYYKVFNVSQCEGLPKEKIPELTKNENNPIEMCQTIYRGMPTPRPEIHEDYDFAFYSGYKDYINMPFIETFESSESYYAVLFHEMVHSTMHPCRLNRVGWYKDSSYADNDEDRYSLEELVAEMGACYLESIAGIIDTRFLQNASYIHGWLMKLKYDKRLIIVAAALAQKATDFILNIKTENDDDISSHIPDNAISVF